MQSVGAVLVGSQELLIDPPGCFQFTRLMVLKRAEQVVFHQVVASEPESRMSKRCGTDGVADPSMVSSMPTLGYGPWSGLVSAELPLTVELRRVSVPPKLNTPPPLLACPMPAVPLPTGPVPPVPPVVPKVVLPVMSLFLSVRLPDAR